MQRTIGVGPADLIAANAREGSSTRTDLSSPTVASGDFLEFRALENDIGRRGVHPWAVISVVALYALFILVVWTCFGGPGAGLTLGVVTLLGLMFFAIVCGGFLTSDHPVRGRARWFNAFLRGQVETWSGMLKGREAYAQMVVLPAALVIAALGFGILWHMAGG